MANIYLTGITNNGAGSNGYIRYFDPDGSGIINALNVTCTDSIYVSHGGFSTSLTGLVLDPTNSFLFVSDSTLHCIWQINLSTNVVTRIAGTGTLGESNVPGPALSVNFRFPKNMCVDAAGNLYVIDSNNVLCFNRQATTQTILGVSIPSGNIANVAGTYNTNTSSGDGGPATSATFTTSVAGNNIAVDSSGNLYIADGSGNINSHRVRIVNSSGIMNNFVGGLTTGHTGNGLLYTNSAVLFGFVCGIAFDLAGNFYIADYESSLRAINLQGTTQTLYNWSIAPDVIDIICDTALSNTSSGDGGQARAATIFNNQALAIDSNGVLYLSQPSGKSCIRAINPKTGIINTVCGTQGNSGDSGNGGLATSAVIESQITIAVQQFANLEGTLSVNASTLPANGKAQATITALVTSSNGNPVSGVTVNITQNGNAVLSATSGVTNSNGIVTFTATDTDVELVTFTASGAPFNTVQVQFTASRVDGAVYGQTGPAVAGAQIYAVQQPASTSTIPPSPLLEIFADPELQEPISQPISTNGLGAYDFYAPNGLFTLVAVNGGKIAQVYSDQEVGKPNVAFPRLDWWVKANNGPAVPGAQIFIVGQPANQPPTLTPRPPSPLIQVYSDSLGQVPVSQPLLTDGFGHANCYVLPGVYTVLVYLNGALQQAYPDQSVGGVSSGPLTRRDLWFRNANGIAQANCNVIVSLQPCTVPAALVPAFPNNLAPICADPTGYVPITQSLSYDANGNPLIQSLTTDGNGHACFYYFPNVPFTISIYKQNKLQVSYPDQIL